MSAEAAALRKRDFSGGSSAWGSGGSVAAAAAAQWWQLGGSSLAAARPRRGYGNNQLELQFMVAVLFMTICVFGCVIVV